MKIIYVMQEGEYSHQRITFVTSDVKEISKVYTKKVKATERVMYASPPYIQIWSKDNLITDFLEWEEDEKRLTKFLSKLAMGLQ